MGSRQTDAEETTLLLEPDLQSQLRPDIHSPEHGRKSVWHILLPSIAVVFLLNAANQLSMAARTEILEDIVCRAHYAHAPSKPQECKVEPVQSEMAFVNGWGDVFDTLPSILSAIPFGVLADNIGRKYVLVLAVIGVVMTDAWVRLVFWFYNIFPVRFVWLGGLWQIIGAGSPGLFALVHAQIADVCTTKQRATAFSLIVSSPLLTELVFIPLGAALSNINPWIPMFGTSLLGILAILVALLLVSETLPPPAAPRANAPNREDDCDKGSVQSRLRRLVTDSAKWAMSQKRLLPIFICFWLFYVGQQADGTLLLQFVSKELGWSYPQASNLLSLRAGVTLAVLGIVIPSLSNFLVQRLSLGDNGKDKCLTQACGILAALGMIFIFFARSSAPLIAGQFLFSLGNSFGVPARSLTAGLVEQRHLGTVFTLVTVITMSGAFAAGPLLAGAFAWGMSLGEVWSGMPFLVAGVCFSLGTLAVSATDSGQVPRQCDDGEQGNDV